MVYIIVIEPDKKSIDEKDYVEYRNLDREADKFIRLRENKLYEMNLKSLIGCSVVKIEEFNNGCMDSGFFITFSNGKILTAQDGEYGDDAFRFVLNQEYNKAKAKKNIFDADVKIVANR